MEPTGPKTEIFVDLQLADLIRANLWFNYSQPSMKFSIVMGLVGFLLATILVMLGVGPSWLVFLPPIVVVLLVITPVVILLESKRNFEAAKEFQKHIQYVFGSEGYEVSDGKSSAHVSWESIYNAVESKHSFNLFVSRKMFVVIPKRCLRTSSDLSNFRSILRGALGGKAALKTGKN